jgi:hypothetical protein
VEISDLFRFISEFVESDLDSEDSGSGSECSKLEVRQFEADHSCHLLTMCCASGGRGILTARSQRRWAWTRDSTALNNSPLSFLKAKWREVKHREQPAAKKYHTPPDWQIN